MFHTQKVSFITLMFIVFTKFLLFLFMAAWEINILECDGIGTDYISPIRKVLVAFWTEHYWLYVHCLLK